MKRTLLFLAVLLSTNVTKAEMLTSNHLYRYAQNKNYQALQNFYKWINITNKNKDTAICLALKDNNIEAYKLLLRYGANPRPSCLARINKYNNTNKNYYTSSSNSETFLGMGTTGWSITGGLLAAGGIAAVAGGGGGGGGGGGSDNSVNLCENVTCGENAVCSSGKCVCKTGFEGNADTGCFPEIVCMNGTKNNGVCICDNGWNGKTCSNPNTCIGYIASCSPGYYSTSDICQSGKNTMYKCELNDCSMYELSCNEGYMESGKTCQSGNSIYVECIPNKVPYGYTKAPCGSGYYMADSIKSGEDTYYKCELNDCSMYKISCSEGYNENGNTCQSGKTIYVECVPNEVPSGYTTTPCNSGYHVIDSIKSGEDTYYKCELNDCSMYELSCNEGYNSTESCLSGTTQYYTCNAKEVEKGYYSTECNEGYIATDYKYFGSILYHKCEECSEGYIKQNGVCYAVCGLNKHKEYDNCVCDDGFTEQDGVCYTTLTCGTNEHQSGNECVCNDGFINQSGVCYAILNCGDNAHQSGNKCVCDSGYIDTYGTCYKEISCSSGTKQYGDYCINTTGTSRVAVKLNENKDYTIQKDPWLNGKYDGSVKLPPLRYMLFNKGNGNIVGAETYINENRDATYSGWLTIYNDGDGEIIGSVLANAYGGGSSTLNIINSGNGTIYGTQGENNYNASDCYSYGEINIYNTGNATVYGADGKNISRGGRYSKLSTGTINIENYSAGNVYGVHGYDLEYMSGSSFGSNTVSPYDGYNQYSPGSYYYYSFNAFIYNTNYPVNGKAEGLIKIKNSGAGNAYGIYGSEHDITINNAGMLEYQESEEYNGYVTGDIKIINESVGNVYGMYSVNNAYNQTNAKYNITSNIEIANIGDGLAVGIYGKNNIGNSGTIKIHNLGEGQAVGIYIDGGTVYNSGTIIIDREDYTDPDTGITYSAPNSRGSKNLHIGIYGTSTSKVNNKGTITISGAHTGYGIHLERGGTLYNDGTINIINGTGLKTKTAGDILFENGVYKKKSSTSTNTASVASTSYNSELLSIEGIESSNLDNIILDTFNLDDIGGEVIATENANFEVDGAIAGNLTMSSDIVTTGFDDVYTTTNTINAGDTSKLNLLSQSILFDASLAENNSDVNLKMKAFDEVVENKSLADFLQSNYALENNETFFNTLKKQETTASLNDTLNDLTGQKLFSRFADEDLMMMRELTFDMNNKLFMSNDDHLETSGSISTFNFNGNSGSNSRYALVNQNYGKYKLGLNYGFANISSYDDNNDNRREEMMFHMGMPISYHKKGFKFITTPHVGYASGSYDRKGLNSENYDGYIEKTMFGLMNEVRYPIAFDKWTIAPSAEFNVVNYATKGHEKGGTNPLNLDLQHNYSVELGLGLYANTEYKLGKQSKLSFTGGVAMYHEFADPYKLSIGMEGMSGKFDIRDENRGDNRAVIRTGLKFDNGNMSLGANVMSYIDKEYRTNATLDFKYGF